MMRMFSHTSALEVATFNAGHHRCDVRLYVNHGIVNAGGEAAWYLGRTEEPVPTGATLHGTMHPNGTFTHAVDGETLAIVASNPRTSRYVASGWEVDIAATWPDGGRTVKGAVTIATKRDADMGYAMIATTAWTGSDLLQAVNGLTAEAARVATARIEAAAISRVRAL